MNSTGSKFSNGMMYSPGAVVLAIHDAGAAANPPFVACSLVMEHFSCALDTW